jgi:hypothetical protein
LKAWPILAIILVQSFLCIAHWFMYRTWIDFWGPISAEAVFGLRFALVTLSFVFVLASLLSFRFSNRAVRAFYWFGALWMGLANFLFVGAGVAWLVDLVLRIAVPEATRLACRPYIAGALVVVSVATAVYGLVNARMIRLRKVTLELPNLPKCWRGRRAALVSDLHLGHINGSAFTRRIAALVR